MAVIVAATPPPAFWWFRYGPSEHDLVLVDATLFSTAGQLAPSSWFARVFGGQFQRPPPLGTHLGQPIYGIDIPGPILREMLHGMRFGALLTDMYQDVPVALAQQVDLATWRTYLEYYVLGVQVPVGAEASPSDDDDGERPRKRARLDDSPFLAHIRRFATALAAKLRAEHPVWTAFAAGAKRTLTCWFVSTYHPDTDDGNHTFYLPLEGPPLVPAVRVAHELMHLGYASKLDVFIPALLAGLGLTPDNTIARLTTHRNHKSKAKTFDMAIHWPACRGGPPVRLTPGVHDIMDLTLAYRT